MAVLVVTAALSVGALGLLRILTNNLNQTISDTARLRAADVATLVQKNSLPQPLAFRGEDSGFVQVVDATGHILASTANLVGEPRIATFTPSTDRPELHTVNTLPGGDGQRFRIVAQRVVGPSGSVLIYTASSLDAADDAIASVRAALMAGIPMLVLLVGVTTWVLTSHVLEPVEGIRRQVLKITGGQLRRRVPVPNTGDEISLLAQTMNDMLERLEVAANRQRRFVADASHELRNPLATMRTTMEVNLAHPTTADWVTTTTDLLVDHDRLERIVADLLTLAKVDAASAPADPQTVDVSHLIAVEIERRPTGRVAIQRTIQPNVAVAGDPHHLTQVIRNLLDNADRHANSYVEVTLDTTETEARLRVMNDGKGIPRDARQRIFEPFTRLDEARDRDHGGSGLGLAIVADLVRLHGGSVIVTEAPATCFEVLLPTARKRVKAGSEIKNGRRERVSRQ